jgi:RimJ/RimL family protein N-acetyltransferase
MEYRDGTRHLVLRPWAVADVDALLAAVAASVTELRRFMPWSHKVMTREEEYALLAKFHADYFAGREYIVGMFSGEGEVLGGLGLHPRAPLNPQALEVGYWSHTAHAGKGNTTLAVRMLLALAFDRFACDRFQVMHDEANTASRRVVEKCGFTYEGTLKHYVFPPTEALRAGGFEGTALTRMYAIVRDDLDTLPWLAEVRAHTTVYDALGSAQQLTQ